MQRAHAVSISFLTLRRKRSPQKKMHIFLIPITISRTSFQYSTLNVAPTLQARVPTLLLLVEEN
jgi:hypothetical protein